MRQIFTKNKNSPDGRISASRRTVRRVLAFVLLFAVCGVSCSNIISERDEIAENTENSDGTENRDEGKAYYSLSGSVGQDGAVPRSVAAPYTNARSAVPNTDGIAKTYIVTAKNTADGTTKTVTVNAPETYFEILLLEGTYTLSVTGYDASDKEILYGKYKNDIVLSKDHAAEQDIFVYVHPISNDGGTGTVNLVMNLTGCGIKSYKAEWKEGGDFNNTLSRTRLRRRTYSRAFYNDGGRNACQPRHSRGLLHCNVFFL